MKDAAEGISTYRQFWEYQFDALADDLEEESKKEEPQKWQTLSPDRKPNSKSGECS